MGRTLTYIEYAYIMGVKTIEAKEIFIRLSESKVDTKTLLPEGLLNNEFPPTRSVDDRFHNKGLVSLKLDQLHLMFRHELSDRGSVKKIGFGGGKNVFNKYLSQADLSFAIDRLAYNHQYIYGQKTKEYKKYLKSKRDIK